METHWLPRTFNRSWISASTTNSHPDSVSGRDETKPGGDAPRGHAPEDPSWLAKLRQHRGLVLLVTAIVVLAAVGLVVWWIDTSGYVTTDDAFIDTRTVTISSQLNAQIVNVPVTDNQQVEAGTVLVNLDDRDFQAQVDQAKAQVEAAQANVANVGAQIAAQQARIEQANKQVYTGASCIHVRGATKLALSGTRQKRLGHAGAGTAVQFELSCRHRPRLTPPMPMPSPRRSSSRSSMPSGCRPRRSLIKCGQPSGRPKSTCRAQ